MDGEANNINFRDKLSPRSAESSRQRIESQRRDIDHVVTKKDLCWFELGYSSEKELFLAIGEIK